MRETGPVSFSSVVNMNSVLLLLLLLPPVVELRRVQQQLPTLETQRDGGTEGPVAPAMTSPLPVEVTGVSELRRAIRGAKDGKRDLHLRRHEDPNGYFTTPRAKRPVPALAANGSGTRTGTELLNPLFPVTDGSYWAYAVMLLALVVFAAGIVGNLALMCIVWHNFYLKSAWNCILAGLAFWDFLVLFFCLPVVVFHELTLKRLLGDLSCRLVPYLEVR